MKFLAYFTLFVTAVSALFIDADIERTFARGENVDVLVHLPQYVPKGYAIQKVRNRAEARLLVRESRRLHNARYQPQVIAALEELNLDFKPFWITNSILVRNVDASLFQKLQSLPNVIELEADKISAHIIAPMVHEYHDEPAAAGVKRAPEWNIEIIGAPAAWNITQGEGITVSNIDTGVLYTHEALIDNYRGNNGGTFDHDYNWFDPRGQRVPYDNNGHGTHTMGTIAGSEASGVGVAPGSRWIAAKGCASSSCATTDLIASAEWVLCPTRQGGAGEDCTKGADLVSNSWGGGRGSSTYLTYVTAWVDAGMVPLFSQGNSGSLCSTANSPGDLGIVIGVGSTDKNDALSSFSSRGPGVGTNTHPLQKPDISAPGEQVRSAYPTSNTAYATLSGTSMACPAVAGLTAMILSANPTITVDEVRDILIKTATTDLPPPKGGQTTCASVPYTQYPNYHYGFGRIDSSAVSAALNYGK